ncbi:HTH-type transcriptional regulator BhcR [Chelativorans sp. YIM 93263]|uniref:HTH-type transcriptional regulator BhcR n=1 Tax=Chelativorans sp. YIM 93263 TaxID=2906648 RepID=UPI0023798819|nr:HTH-type transcriptional regulator BhcR [Chelativorans sp. YIM 93263]
MQKIGRARGRPRSFHNTAENTLIQSLDRAMDVLKVVADANGLSLTEIAQASGQAASTAYRILITLEKHGIVQFDEPAQLWHVGLEAFRIGSSFLGRTRIVEQSRPVMQRIMTATGETANLAIIDQGEVIFVSQVETHEPIRAFFRPGTRGPVHASGIGKALLAFLPQPQIEALLMRAPLDAFTKKTIVLPSALIAEIETIRARGWSIDDEEGTLGMRCIAAPIFNQLGEAVAGVSLSGPAFRVTPERDAEYGALVRSAAEEITAAIGGTAPRH